MKRYFPLMALFALAAGLCGNALAQAPAQDVSVEDLAKALTPNKGTTRSLSRNLQVGPPKVDLVINFDYDSAVIQDSSRPQLQRLATAMKLEQLQTLSFRAEGHTDGKGSASYNQALSEKRAKSVVGFLSAEGVDVSRLVAEGRGFSELLVKDNPNAPENRRVRIATLEK